MNKKGNKEKNTSDFLTFIKTIFDCSYDDEIFVKKNLLRSKEIELKELYPIYYIVKDAELDNYNYSKNIPILYFPSAEKITAKVPEKELQLKKSIAFVGFNTEIIFNKNPAAKNNQNEIIAGELCINHDYDTQYGVKNTLLDVYTVFELILSIKDKNKKNKIVNALNSNLKEKFNIFSKMKRDPIILSKKMKNKIYDEHFEYFPETQKIKRFYQYKNLISTKKCKAKILFDGYCNEEKIYESLIKAFQDIIVFYRVFFAEIILTI
jgi:hypothetical protein